MINARAAIKTALVLLGMVAYAVLTWIVGAEFALYTLILAWGGLAVYFIYEAFVTYGNKRNV